MPNIDVTELFEDPDFADEFTVIRRSAVVGENGRQVITEDRIPGQVGAIVPASYRTRRDNPDFSQETGMMEIYSRFAFQGIVNEFISDLIEWDGNQYNVVAVDNWSRWGAGWRKAVAVLTQPKVNE